MKNSKLLFISIMLIHVFVNGCSQGNIDLTEYENNTKNTLDMLTPAYYNSNTDISFIEDINLFLSFAQQEPFHHPLKNESGQIPDFTVPFIGKFGAGKGPGGTAQHHPAVDLHVGNGETNVTIYAAHDGTVATVKNADKYRQYVSITKDIKNDNEELIGKLVTLYAHVDLDIDESESFLMNGKQITKGEIVSRHLYTGTVGGPHLHFEIRYYRPRDTGNETFYGFSSPNSPNFTEPSAGGWLYGVWNPDVGFGFGNPKSHGLDLY